MNEEAQARAYGSALAHALEVAREAGEDEDDADDEEDAGLLHTQTEQRRALAEYDGQAQHDEDDDADDEYIGGFTVRRFDECCGIVSLNREVRYQYPFCMNSASALEKALESVR